MTREELILEMMPFSRQLKEWCCKHPEFAEALKFYYPPRFITLQAVATSYSPLVPKDEVIGFYLYDFKVKKFKQDFIINKDKRDEEFVLYTRHPKRKYGKYVRDINEFYSTYSQGKYYIQSHHVAYNDLPDELKERAVRAKNLAEKLVQTGLRILTQEELQEIANKVRKEKIDY